MLVDALSAPGRVVSTADNAARAFEALERLGGVDVLLTDQNMPTDNDGSALIAETKKRWPQTKCVLMSGRHGNLAEAERLNARFLPKPYRLEEVLFLCAT